MTSSGSYDDWQYFKLGKKDKNPYGAFLLHQLLGKHPKHTVEYMGKKRVSKALSPDEKGNYLFVDRSYYIRNSDFDTLAAFVKQGNKALIITSEITPSIHYKLLALDSTYVIDTVQPPLEVMDAEDTLGDPFETVEEVIEYNEEDSSFLNASDFLNEENLTYDSSIFTFDEIKQKAAHVNFYHDSLKKKNSYHFTFRGKYGSIKHDWKVLAEKSEEYMPSNLSYLGSFNSKRVNFLKIDYGEGSFYIHTQPILFSNYFLKKEEGYNYASNVFSHLDEGTIFIDERSAYIGYGNSSGGGNLNRSILRHFLKEPSMAWAWYMGLGMVLLYVLIQSKRKQRILPFIPPKKNVSLAYAQTIGRLYFLKNNHLHLAKQKVQLFTYYMKNRHGIVLGQWSDEVKTKIKIKTRKTSEEIDALAEVIDFVAKAQIITEKDLHRIEMTLKFFYQ